MDKELFTELSRKQQMCELLEEIRKFVEDSHIYRQESKLNQLLEEYKLEGKEREIIYQYTSYLKGIYRCMRQHSPLFNRVSRIGGMVIATVIAGGVGYFGGHYSQGEQQALKSMEYTAIAGLSLEWIIGPFYSALIDFYDTRKRKRFEEQYLLIKENAQWTLEEIISNKLK
ncbi:MAG: hypothetical protein ABIA37_03240 [Candidatus Woesearchaeota archaeon]